MREEMVSKINQCSTGDQVRRVLKENGIRIIRDDSKEVGCFSIWIDETTRIYKPHKRKFMKLQKWQKVNYQYSGIPVFFG